MNEIEQMLEDCENRSEKLTDWECRFIDSVSVQIGRAKSLSEKQVNTLSNIWERVTE